MNYGSANFGAQDWATFEELKTAGLTERDPAPTIPLGVDMRSDAKLWYHGDAHRFVLAPPGSGKTAAVAIPQLLFDRRSMIVTDPKCTLAVQTMKFRKDYLKQKIVVLNPFREFVKNDIGVDLGDTGFNPLSLLRLDDPDLIDNAEMIAAMICPTPHDAKDPYWTETGADIETGLLLLMTASDKYQCTLPELYNLVRLVYHDDWQAVAEEMNNVENIDLSAYASMILSPMKSERQFAGIEGAMIRSTRIYNPQKALAAHVSKNGFNPDDLKTQKTTVYIILPSKRRDANKAWMALVTALCAEAVGRGGASVSVAMLCEEFQNLGYLPSITRAMAEYREAGLHVTLCVQSLKVLRTIYGKDGADGLIDLCGVRQYFGVDNLETAQEIVGMIGLFTALDTNNGSIQQTGVPLIRAEQILNLPDGLQIILMRGSVPPILAYITPYYYSQAQIECTAPNPYRNEPEQRAAVPWIKNVPQQEMVRSSFREELRYKERHILLWCVLFIAGMFLLPRHFIQSTFGTFYHFMIFGMIGLAVFEAYKKSKKTKWRNRAGEYQANMSAAQSVREKPNNRF